MKRPHKMKLLDEVVADLKKEYKEVTHSSILSKCINWPRMQVITGSDVARYLREFYVETD